MLPCPAVAHGPIQERLTLVTAQIAQDPANAELYLERSEALSKYPPLFLGFVVGEYIMGGAFIVLGLITGKGYRFLPG